MVLSIQISQIQKITQGCLLLDEQDIIKQFAF